MNVDIRAMRIYTDLNNAFRRDKDINEFDYIPVLEPKNNKSPVVLVDHKLGLELWSVRILFQYAYHKLMQWRTTHKFTEPGEVVLLSRTVVLVNPECYTAWNIRKELVELGEVSELEDLKLSALVLGKHPKSSETFVHRRWLLGRFIENHLQSSQGSTQSTGSGHDGFVSMEAIDLNLDPSQNQVLNGHENLHVAGMSEYHRQMKTEIQVCTCAADKYPCNYYAWTQRRWLMQHCFNCSVRVLLAELDRTEVWVSKHISDTCGYQYRQFLLSNLQSQSEQLRDQYSMTCVTLLEKEHTFIQDLISTYPGHEAMWNHRKFVFHSLHNQYCDTCTKLEDQDSESHLKKSRLEYDQHILEQKEIDSVHKNELKSKTAAQKTLAQRYIDWIKRTVIK